MQKGWHGTQTQITCAQGFRVTGPTCSVSSMTISAPPQLLCLKSVQSPSSPLPSLPGSGAMVPMRGSREAVLAFQNAWCSAGR